MFSKTKLLDLGSIFLQVLWAQDWWFWVNRDHSARFDPKPVGVTLGFDAPCLNWRFQVHVPAKNIPGGIVERLITLLKFVIKRLFDSILFVVTVSIKFGRSKYSFTYKKFWVILRRTRHSATRIFMLSVVFYCRMCVESANARNSALAMFPLLMQYTHWRRLMAAYVVRCFILRFAKAPPQELFPCACAPGFSICFMTHCHVWRETNQNPQVLPPLRGKFVGRTNAAFWKMV